MKRNKKSAPSYNKENDTEINKAMHWFAVYPLRHYTVCAGGRTILEAVSCFEGGVYLKTPFERQLKLFTYSVLFSVYPFSLPLPPGLAGNLCGGLERGLVLLDSFSYRSKKMTTACTDWRLH